MPVVFTPSPGAAFADFAGVTLNGSQFNVRLRWNARDDAWYMDVRDFENNAIAIGLKCVLGVYVGRQCAHPLFTNGAFILVDTDGGGEAKFDDLASGRVVLSYWPASELIAQMYSEALGDFRAAVSE